MSDVIEKNLIALGEPAIFCLTCHGGDVSGVSGGECLGSECLGSECLCDECLGGDRFELCAV
jgi:hypothetical protein